MSKRVAVCFALCLLIAVGGWAGAQPGPGEAKKAEAGSERYIVTGMGSSAILLETTSGKTWSYQMSLHAQTGVWLPVKRLDTPEEVNEFLKVQNMMIQIEHDRQRAKDGK